MYINPCVKNILSALAVAVFGFVLLNLTFMLDFLFHSVVIWFIKLFTLDNPETDWYWFPHLMHVAFVALIGLISWPIFRSKLGTLYKAIYLTVPLAVILVSIGIFLYPWPALPYLVSGLFTISVLFYLYRTRQHWLYYYAVLLVALTLMIFALSGGEI